MINSIIKRDSYYLFKILSNVLVIFFWLMIWQLVYLLVNQEIILPSPINVFKRLIELMQEPYFWIDTIMSMCRIILGFILAVVIGTLLSIFSSMFSFVRFLLQPLIHIIKTTPIVSFIMIAIVWIKSNGVPIFISFLIVVPIIWGNLIKGISKVDRNLIDMAKIFYPGELNVIRKVYIPSVMPFFISACSTSIGLAWKAGIAAEVISQTKYSMGIQMYNSKIYIETMDLFAWTLVVIFMSMLIEHLMIFIIKRFKCYNI